MSSPSCRIFAKPTSINAKDFRPPLTVQIACTLRRFLTGTVLSNLTTNAAACGANVCTLVDLMSQIYISNFFAVWNSATQVRDQEKSAGNT